MENKIEQQKWIDYPAYIATTSFYPNCPVHDGGFYDGMKKFSSIEEIKKFILENLGNYRIDDVISLYNDDKIEVIYEESFHSINGAILEINKEKICRTIDNGSGKLIWGDEN